MVRTTALVLVIVGVIVFDVLPTSEAGGVSSCVDLSAEARDAALHFPGELVYDFNGNCAVDLLDVLLASNNCDSFTLDDVVRHRRQLEACYAMRDAS
jgi:hypothetical protein